MLGTITGALTAIGASQSVAKKAAPWVAGGVAVALLVVGFLVWDHFDDKAAIKQDRTKREAVEAKAALEAERRANAAGADRNEARQAASAQTKSKLQEIEDADPKAARQPAPAGSRAVADRLRRNGGRGHR